MGNISLSEELKMLLLSFLILNKFNTNINIETCVLNYVKIFTKGTTS